MSEGHNIFISWSGPQSKWVAEALRKWLPRIVQSAKPWMSDADIEKGTRGLNEVSSGLQGMKVGVVCLTPENMDAPWILYEAGALSKSIDQTRLCTYLLGGLQSQDVKPPLSMFQWTNPDKQDTQKLVRTINKAVSDKPVPEVDLDYLFDLVWPDLESTLKTLPSSRVATPKRSTDDMVAELLEIARGEVNYREAIQGQISRLENTLLHRAAFGWERSFAESPQSSQPGTIVAGAIPWTTWRDGVPVINTDPSEEEQRKADAIRKARESKGVKEK